MMALGHTNSAHLSAGSQLANSLTAHCRRVLIIPIYLLSLDPQGADVRDHVELRYSSQFIVAGITACHHAVARLSCQVNVFPIAKAPSGSSTSNQSEHGNTTIISRSVGDWVMKTIHVTCSIGDGNGSIYTSHQICHQNCHC